MVFFYKDYPFAPKYTFISLAAEFGALFSAFGGIALIITAFKSGNYLLLLPGVVLLPLGVFLYLRVYRKIIPEKAAIASEINIKTKGKYAASYCWRHPEAYEELMQINPDFAARYTRNEKGRIVKRK